MWQDVVFHENDNSICAMYLRNILGVNTVYGVAHVLPGGDKEREGEASHHRDRVMKPEDARVDLDMGKFHQTLQSAK